MTGLASQALSYRREANGKDYLHKYYEDLVLEREQLLDKAEEGLGEGSHLFESTNVSMGREYLKAYQIFDREVREMEPRLKKLIA